MFTHALAQRLKAGSANRSYVLVPGFGLRLLLNSDCGTYWYSLDYS